MESLLNLLKKKSRLALNQAFPMVDPHLLEPEVFQSTQEQFGDYQLNNSLKLAKHVRMSPKDVAHQIVSYFDKGKEILWLEIAGPGFINIKISPEFLSKEIYQCLLDPRLGVPKLGNQQKIIVEFSSPNIAKELHVGHLRSTIIGESIARLFEFLDYKVLRLSHIGDWGTQFGMLITYLKDYLPDLFSSDYHPDIFQLMQWYRASKLQFDKDDEFKKKAQLQVVSLQSGEKEALEVWKKICLISHNSYQEIYDLLDISLQERGESFYNDLLPLLISDLEQKGLLVSSQGAKCIFLEGFLNREGEPLPLILQKSDGGFNYATTDLAAIKYRIEKDLASRIIYVIDSGQSLHMQMIFKAAEKAGYLQTDKVRADHVGFGVVLGADGKKFKTRSGDTERLIDLLKEAIDHAKVILEKRMPEETPEKITEFAQILGVDAVKYADLCCHRIKDYVFTYERMLRFEGNTAAFLLYSYVRIQGIKRRINKDIKELKLREKITLTHSSEISLALHLRQFPEILESLSEDLLPHRLAEYVYHLAEKFNAFFRDCRVEATEEENSRLLLCEISGLILKKGLEILGLKTLEKM